MLKTRKTMVIIATVILMSFTCSCQNNNSDSSSETKREKLKFDNAIMDTDSVDVCYSLKLTRKEWTKDSLTDCYTEAFTEFSGQVISKDDLIYDYLGESEDSGKIDDSFYMLYSDTENVSSRYQHFSCYYKSEFNYAGKQISLVGSQEYFSENTDKRIYDKAESCINMVEDRFTGFLSPETYDMFPYRYRTGDKGCFFQYGVKYKDIPFDTSVYVSMDEDNPGTYLSASFAEILIDNENNIRSFTSYNNWDVSETEKYEEILSFDEACEIVEENISEDVVFNVTRADLVYKLIEANDENTFTLYWTAEPCWKFTIDASGIAAFPRIAFLVNAVTGEFESYQLS
ncbi:MAG: hypothetical protein IKL04_04650 [Lachnospiraceae bacterium]|nr:hypothetical protein [Lachnospiraceae bacterium]